MKKRFVVFFALLIMAAMAIPAAQAATMTEKVAKAVCAKEGGTLELNNEDMAYWVDAQKYEGMYQVFTEDEGVFAQFKKTPKSQANSCSRVVYGKDKNGVWQKQGLFVAPVVLSGKTVSAPKWTKAD